jgi:hypothetical protein
MDAAGEARLMKAIIPQRDEIQERKILVIYYIELRTRYFNHFAMRIFDILLYISVPISQSKEVEKIYALSKQPTQWRYSKWGVKNDIQGEYLDTLFKQAKRLITNVNNVKRIYIVDGVVTTIAESERRKGLFPDDGLFKLFEPLTDKDIRDKIVAENRRITSFLTIIENILVACVAEYADFKETFETIKDTFKKARDRFETFSRATNIASEKRSSRFSLSSSKKIAPASSPTSPTSHTLFDYSQNDLREFITITDAVFDSVDTIAYNLKDIKKVLFIEQTIKQINHLLSNLPLTEQTIKHINHLLSNLPLIEQTVKQINHLLSNRREYITHLSELITVYKFKSTTFPVRESHLVNYYDELMKPKVSPKTPNVSPKPKPTYVKHNRDNRDNRDNRNMEYEPPKTSKLPPKYRKNIERKVHRVDRVDNEFPNEITKVSSGGRIPKIPKNKPKDTKKKKPVKPVKPVKPLRRQWIRLRLP